MANKFDIKSKTFFQIPPTEDCQRVVFMGQGFDLDDIQYISEPYFVTELSYKFFIRIGYSEHGRLEFDFKRKGDCLMGQRELSRAWTKTGEFDYTDTNTEEQTT